MEQLNVSETIGGLRYQDGDAHENVILKVNFCSSYLYRDYSNSFTMSNESELFLSRIPKNHIQVWKEKENLAVACLHSPIKDGISEIKLNSLDGTLLSHTVNLNAFF